MEERKTEAQMRRETWQRRREAMRCELREARRDPARRDPRQQASPSVICRNKIAGSGTARYRAARGSRKKGRSRGVAVTELRSRTSSFWEEKRERMDAAMDLTEGWNLST